MADLETIRIDYDERGVATVTMNRPEARNAFDDRLIGELHDVATGLGADDGVRVVVLTGAGEVFSAGADLAWMRSTKDYAFDENLADAKRIAAMFRALYELPKPLVGRVNGHALGGGAGLAAVCDIAVAVDDATFGFTEVRVGLAPAAISPYVVRKVGRSFARSVFVTGEHFSAERAFAAGLVHALCSRADLDAITRDAVDRCLAAAPRAVAVAKRLPDLALEPLDVATEHTAKLVAELRVGEEGQEGMQAFLDGRAPNWRYP